MTGFDGDDLERRLATELRDGLAPLASWPAGINQLAWSMDGSPPAGPVDITIAR